MPLNSTELCEADIITPASALYFFTSIATAGVGTTPRIWASAPTEQIPATNADSRMSPEIRVSLPMIILALWFVSLVSTIAAALPICIASSQVSSVIATPLAPSVPNNLPIIISSFSRSYLYIIFYLCKLYINTHIKLIRYTIFAKDRTSVAGRRTKIAPTEQEIHRRRRYLNSSFLTPHSSLSIPHSSLLIPD